MLKFTDVLHRVDVEYVIISGYVPVLFGRSRQTEDVDIFIEDMDYEKLVKKTPDKEWSRQQNVLLG